MKVWSRTLAPRDLHEAAQQVNDEFPGARVYLGGDGPDLYEGPRTRRIDRVHLRAETSWYHPNSGTNGALVHTHEMAASWTEWGWFLARVFERDPLARCGQYKDLDDFNVQTGDRFIDPRSPRERQVKRELRKAVNA